MPFAFAYGHFPVAILYVAVTRVRLLVQLSLAVQLDVYRNYAGRLGRQHGEHEM